MATKKFYPRPDTMVIGLHTYTIEWLTHDEWDRNGYDNSKCGMHWADQQKISIRLLPGARESFLQEVLFHELLHAAWANSQMDGADAGAMSRDDREEFIVGILSPNMMMMLRQNQHVADYLFKADGDKVR